ncbi:MAG: hypothetical protein ACRD1T_19800, partial [Acidimicrobiia bacterium]
AVHQRRLDHKLQDHGDDPSGDARHSDLGKLSGGWMLDGRDAGHFQVAYITISIRRGLRSGCMSSSSRLEVTDIRRLVGGSLGGVHVSLTGEGITARALLTGEFGGQPLVGVVRRSGRPRDLVGTFFGQVCT